MGVNTEKNNVQLKQKGGSSCGMLNLRVLMLGKPTFYGGKMNRVMLRLLGSCSFIMCWASGKHWFDSCQEFLD